MDPSMLAACLQATLSPDLEPRKQAEAQLSVASSQPGHILVVLQLIAMNEGIDRCTVELPQYS